MAVRCSRRASPSSLDSISQDTLKPTSTNAVPWNAVWSMTSRGILSWARAWARVAKNSRATEQTARDKFAIRGDGFMIPPRPTLTRVGRKATLPNSAAILYPDRRRCPDCSVRPWLFRFPTLFLANLQVSIEGIELLGLGDTAQSEAADRDEGRSEEHTSELQSRA